MDRYEGRTVVVTGGTSGIGLATASAFVSEGAHVVVAGRDHERGETVRQRLIADGGVATFVRTDVAQDDQVATLADEAARWGGGIDVWFNNAGFDGPVGPLDELDDVTARALLDINVKGVFSGMRHAVRQLRGGGVIVNNASFVGTAVPVPVAVLYGATKAAVVSMTRSAAAGLRARGIAVHAVCPWIVDTPMLDRVTGGQGPQARREFAAAFAPSGTAAPPGDVARVVLDLAAGEATDVSGSVVLVDAGPQVTPLAAWTAPVEVAS